MIEKSEDIWIRHFNNPNAFIECLNMMDDVYENINDYNPIKKEKNELSLMTWLQILWQIKSKNCLLGVEN